MSEPIKISVTLSPLPTNFKGTPQQWAEAVVARLTLLSEDGFATFSIADVLPTVDQGPVFLGGTKIYVWDADQSTYIPLDIEDSFTPAFVIQETTPAAPDGSIGTNPPVWMKIKGTRLIGFYYWVSAEIGWVPMSGVTPTGSTANRPVLPHDFERYYDTDISAEIWWERGAWRTTSGVKGDVKFVDAATLDAALTQNPGWVEIGHVSSALGVGARGRVLVPAHKDEGVTPATSYTPQAGITSRAAREQFGEETHVLTADETALKDHNHKIGVVEEGISGPATNGRLHADGGINTEYDSQSTTDYGRTLGVNDGDVIAPGDPNTNEEDGDPHNNIQPSLALWCLVKT